MYEVIDIVDDDATRFIKLKNIDTDIIEECFDDSAVVSDNNFEFMQIGQKYECKIKLFGKPLAERTSNSIICKVVNREVVIGQRAMVEVEINNSKYYIPRQKVSEYLDNDVFHFCFTRKDLVQVNNIIHADLL
ncbi:MAG: hypothetical protein IKL78_02375 [Lachnospiraceae bacterium]|nr:hypothetical protein [Lachnospiraceae bacterium]